MVATKHLIFLTLVSITFGLYSFYNVGLFDSTNTSPSRSISSEGEITPLDISSEENHQILRNETNANDEAIENETSSSDEQNNRPSQITRSQQKEIRSRLDNHAMYREYCKLPRSMQNPVLYERYCKNQACLRVNESCTNNNKCCSGLCVNNRCAVSQEHKALPGETCTEPRDCYTGICMPATYNPRINICYGDSSTLYCSKVTEPCTDNKHCCSNYCQKNKCQPSTSDRGQLGSPCTDHNHCISNYCSVQTNRCE